MVKKSTVKVSLISRLRAVCVVNVNLVILVMKNLETIVKQDPTVVITQLNSVQLAQEGISDESQADECSSGTYCPGVDEIGSLNVQECPSGTYFVGTGAEDDKSCDLCLPGQYCVNSGLSGPTGVCEYGYNCDKEGETVSNPQDKICPKGSFCNGNSTEPCPIGYYRDLEGGMPVDDCFKCPAGKYCNSLGLEKSAENLDLCPKGYYCDGYDVSTDSKMKKPCGEHHYCPEGSLKIQ